MALFNNSIESLITEFLNGSLSEADFKELDAWIKKSNENKELFEKLTDKKWISGELEKLYSYNEDKGWEKIIEVSPFEKDNNVLVNSFKENNIPKLFQIGIWKKISAAAAILILIISCYFLFFNSDEKKRELVKMNGTAGQDIKAPQNTKAMIVLSDGKKVLLDSVTIGTLAIQQNVKVEKNSKGEIVYSGSSNEIEYNTLVNPRGSKTVTLTLADGTKVWMNTESSLTFFTSVGNGDRRVEISGECYFEVAHDPTKAFIVKDISRDTEIKVLGTHFNVNSYTDESRMKVTLLQGSVTVSKGTVINRLKPGEQAQVTNEIKIVNSVDLNEVMAWKNDLFQFNKSSLEEVMRQIARWYDVEISYEGKISPQKFGGKMQRDLNLSEVLEGLEKTQVHFRIEGKKLIVMP